MKMTTALIEPSIHQNKTLVPSQTCIFLQNQQMLPYKYTSKEIIDFNLEIFKNKQVNIPLYLKSK